MNATTCAGPECDHELSGRKDQRFCSDLCRAKASRLNRFQRKLTNLGLPLTLPCELCGTRFVRDSMSQRRCNPNRKATPDACRAMQEDNADTAAIEKASRTTYTFTCGHAGCRKVNTVPRTRGKKPKFCGMLCRNRAYRADAALVAAKAGADK